MTAAPTPVCNAAELAKYPQPPPALLALFLAYVLFLYLQGGYRLPALGAWRIEFVMGGIMLPFAVRRAAAGITPPSRPLLRWAIVLLSCMGLMVALSQYPAYSLGVWWDRAVKFAIFGAFIVAFVSDPRSLRLFVLFFLLSFLKMAEEGLVGAFTGGLLWENQEVLRLHGATPNYDHPNSFSGTQLGTAPFLYYLYPLLPWYWRAAILIQGGLCAHVIVWAGSRTSYLGLIGAVLATIWQAQRKLRTAVIVVAVALLLWPLIPSEYVGRFDTIFTDNSEVGAETSIGKRKEILVDATQIFASYPFGVGVGAFPLVRQATFGRDQDTHNLYLEVATNLGIEGCFIFLAFIVCLWGSMRRVARDLGAQTTMLTTSASVDPRLEGHLADLKFMKAIADALWVFLIIRLVVGAFGMDMYEVYWWFMSGLTIALLNMNRTARARTATLSAELVHVPASGTARGAQSRHTQALPVR